MGARVWIKQTRVMVIAFFLLLLLNRVRFSICSNLARASALLQLTTRNIPGSIRESCVAISTR